MNFVDKHSDKLVVMAVMVVLLIAAILGIKWLQHERFIEVCLELTKQFAAALLTLLVGARIATRTGDTNGTGNGNGAQRDGTYGSKPPIAVATTAPEGK